MPRSTRFGLAALAERPARVLSGGEQQRLALARAWALKPEVLFLDEPTSALDPAATRAIEELVQSFDADGVKIVMSTHDLGQARRLADEVLFLHHGRLVEHGAGGGVLRRAANARKRAPSCRASCSGETNQQGRETHAPDQIFLPPPRSRSRRSPARRGAQEKFITVASTTSTEQSGLFGYLLPLFQEKTGIEVRVVAQGTGQALETGSRGDADVVFVHAPAAEKEFVAEGVGVKRFEVMYNDFVIVGPGDDPAGVKGMSEAAAALDEDRRG